MNSEISVGWTGKDIISDVITVNDTKEFQKVISAVKKLRYKIYLFTLYSMGLRLGEALALRREDVDLRAGMILIRDGKFYKSRHLPIGPRLTHALAEYLDTVPAWRGPAPSAFFVNRRGGSMPHQTAWWNFASLRERVQVQGRVHDLRQHAGSRIMPGCHVAWRKTLVDPANAMAVDPA